MHAVFDVSPETKYSQDFWRRYDIPTRSAADTARACIGDWIVFRQTGVRGYIAVARVEDVIPDPRRPGFSIALIDDFLPFVSPVRFKEGERYAELSLRLIARSVHVGQAVQGKPVRELELFDFRTITLAGFARTVRVSGETIAIAREPQGFEDETGSIWEYEPAPRKIQDLLVRRAFRDANFRLEVCARYEYKCAFTGVSIADGKLFDVDTAHIRPVKDHGPDIVQNALCACKLFHWSFDRHLISLDKRYRPLIAPGKIPPKYLSLLPPPGDTIYLPLHTAHWPAKTFLDHHRARFRMKNDL